MSPNVATPRPEEQEAENQAGKGREEAGGGAVGLFPNNIGINDANEEKENIGGHEKQNTKRHKTEVL